MPVTLWTIPQAIGPIWSPCSPSDVPVIDANDIIRADSVVDELSGKAKIRTWREDAFPIGSEMHLLIDGKETAYIVDTVEIVLSSRCVFSQTLTLLRKS